MKTVTSFSRFVLPAAILMAALQSGILLYTVTSRAAVLRNGSEVLLETTPVDPRDLLRGDYVVLNYTIGAIPASLVKGDWPQGGGRYPVYVRLQVGEGGYWNVAEASFSALENQDGTVVLKGITNRLPRHPSLSSLSVQYGMERYYVPEGEGKVLEDARNAGRISIAARVSTSGVAHIRALLQDGKPVYEEPLY